MSRLLKIQVLIIITMLFLSCENNEHRHNISTKQAKKTLKGVNKYLAQDDEDVMVGYARRKGWNMKIDSTGMLFEIYHKGNGEKAKKLKFITLNYTVSLLDGTVCYSSDSIGVLKFRILQGGKESGLEY
jgi:FKBP-type peptidyl-prolyl cis-trans isomerase